ncbi:protein SMALL AUXIN UP-REGULATED RNA 12-like [Vicia villosa]|uniref:protein SMALL AUXIN UP-REGULATED RNA 12-like n=1 Tax=Vicia villosa TaxID=3911 RepID=UPI00273AD905|nr:protein SMALL AUXIN UP-REGULATED RNA 12-like [Vicia villosa]
MLEKKIVSLKKLVKKVKVVVRVDRDTANNKLLKEYEEEEERRHPIVKKSGVFALYVGEERQRYVVPTSYLCHPLFKMLLEKAYNEFGFQQRNGLVVPCSVSAFQEVVSAIECNNCKFNMENIFDELI